MSIDRFSRLSKLAKENLVKFLHHLLCSLFLLQKKRGGDLYCWIKSWADLWNRDRKSVWAGCGKEAPAGAGQRGPAMGYESRSEKTKNCLGLLLWTAVLATFFFKVFFFF